MTTTLEEMGEEVDESVNTVPKLRKEIQALTGVDILNEAGDGFRSTYEILLDIAKIWPSLSDMEQSAVLEDLGGKNQANILSSLLSNVDTLRNAYDVAEDSSGTLAKDNEAYLTSITSKLNILQASFQSLSTNLLDSDLVKGAVDFLTKVVDLLDKAVQNFGSLTTIVGGYGVIK